MPDYDEERLDSLLSAAFALLPPPLPPPSLRSRVADAIATDAARLIPTRFHVWERRQANRVMRIMQQTTSIRETAAVPITSPPHKRIERVRTTVISNRKGTP